MDIKKQLMAAPAKLSHLARGFRRGAIGVAALGAAPGVVGCDAQLIADQVLVFETPLVINDANINDFTYYDLVKYNKIKIVIHDPGNIGAALALVRNFLNNYAFNQDRYHVNLDVTLSCPNMPKINNFAAMDALVNMAQLVSALVYKQINVYEVMFADDIVNIAFTDRIETRKLAPNIDFNFRVGFQTLDISNIGPFVNEASSLRPFVDIVHILQSVGFKIIGLDNFPRLNVALKDAKNPYFVSGIVPDQSQSLYLGKDAFHNRSR